MRGRVCLARESCRPRWPGGCACDPATADRLAILDVISRADEAASRRDADAYVALFTPDAVLDGAQGQYAGREALRASVGKIIGCSRRHEVPSSSARTNCSVTLDFGSAGERATVPGAVALPSGWRPDCWADCFWHGRHGS